MIATQTQATSPSFSPSVFEHLNGAIKTDTLVSPEYFKLLSAQIEREETEPFHFVIEFEHIECSFNFQIVRIDWSLLSNKIDLYLNLNNQLIIKATLQGIWEQNEEPNFKLEQFNLKLEKNFPTPLSEFLTTSLWAILGLSPKFQVRIPELNQAFSAEFELPISQIRGLLETRQIAQRLMVIETALNVHLPFPQGFIDGKDIENIAFCYHAIMDRQFDWFFRDLTFFPLALEEYLQLLPKTNVPFLLEFPTLEETRVIFNHSLNIGRFLIRIEQTIIENYDEAIQGMRLLNGQPVKVHIHSLNGKMRLIAIKVPFLQNLAWGDELWKLINLDKKLDEMLLERYFNLASSTLDGLTVKQKKEVTKRFKINKTPRISQ